MSDFDKEWERFESQFESTRKAALAVGLVTLGIGAAGTIAFFVILVAVFRHVGWL